MIYRKYSYPVTANIHKARNKFSLQFFLLEMVYHWWCSISSLTKSSSPLEVGTRKMLFNLKSLTSDLLLSSQVVMIIIVQWTDASNLGS